eukprot:TRINITY_DN67521_c0_g1_i1.p1 TRINITY_DN67521_c0_g1~~TRINITY_DN67521_c0_g1_i1.p1  ORF type:complete len:335 (-),score=40.73 TRINITY_DN67521_c0_g1_i1:388-1392(-)
MSGVIQMPGPFLVAAVGTAAVLGGGGVWCTYPSQMDASHQKLHYLIARAHELQGRLMGQVGPEESVPMTMSEAEDVKISSWLHRFDKDRSGGVSANEIVDALDTDGDGHLTEAESHSFVGDAIVGFLHVDGIRARTFLMVALITSILVGFVTLICYRFSWRCRKPSTPTSDVGTFEVTELRCRDLLNITDSDAANQPSDMYVEVYVGGTKRVTPVRSHEPNPTFSSEELGEMRFQVDFKDAKRGKDTVRLYVFHTKGGKSSMYNTVHKPESMGHAQLRIKDVFAARDIVEVKKWVPLTIDCEEQPGGGIVRQEMAGRIMVGGVFKPDLPKGAKK